MSQYVSFYLQFCFSRFPQLILVVAVILLFEDCRSFSILVVEIPVQSFLSNLQYAAAQLLQVFDFIHAGRYY